MASNTLNSGSQEVQAVYIGTGGADIALTTSDPFRFDLKVIDTHNAVTTGSLWRFTAPISGVYQFSGREYQITTSADIVWKINGAPQEPSEAGIFVAGTATNVITGTFYLNEGDYISMYGTNNTTQSDSMAYNVIQIVKVG